MILGTPSSVKQDIGGLQVAMDDPALVGIMDGPRQGLDQAGRVTRVLEQAREPAVESAAGGIFEDEIAHSFVLADLEDLDDVGMLKPGRRLGLGVEPGGRPRIRISIGSNHLEGHDPLEADLPGFVNRTHAATPELAQDLEARRNRSNRGRRQCFSSVPRPLGQGSAIGLREPDPPNSGRQCSSSCLASRAAKLREAPVKLFGAGRIAQLLAQQELAVDQLEGGLTFVQEPRVASKVGLGRNPLTGAPAPDLVVAELAPRARSCPRASSSAGSSSKSRRRADRFGLAGCAGDESCSDRVYSSGRRASPRVRSFMVSPPSWLKRLRMGGALTSRLPF